MKTAKEMEDLAKSTDNKELEELAKHERSEIAK